jgi:histidinol-phosphate aminotransferase
MGDSVTHTEPRFLNSVLGHIKEIPPYVPGKPIEELEAERGIKGAVKLASNENPLGPSPLAVEAVQGFLRGMHRYPDSGCSALKKSLARRWNVSPECVVVGNGSDEIIDLAMRVFVGSGDEVIFPWPSFLMYEKCAQTAGGKAVRTPLSDFRQDLGAMLNAVGPRTKMIIICQPNNPTGTAVSRAEFEAFLQEVPGHIPLILDEAYGDFVRDSQAFSGKDYLDRHPQVLVLRTFSKAYGLAGIRIGYGLGHPEMIACLHQVCIPFNVNSLAQKAAGAALDDEEFLRKTVEHNWSELDFLYAGVKRLGLPYVPSQTNFFLIRVGNGKDIYEGLLDRGVIVRPMDAYGLAEYIRVNVGLREENERFLDALEAVRRGSSR